MEKAMLGMQAVFSELERAMIVGRVRGSHEHRARAGFVTGGTVYGYRNVRRPDGFVEHAIEEGQAEVVREVFARRAEGVSIRAITLDLNRRRVPSPSGGRRGTGSWSPGALHEILHRERYLGVLEWGRTRKGYGTVARCARSRRAPTSCASSAPSSRSSTPRPGPACEATTSRSAVGAVERPRTCSQASCATPRAVGPFRSAAPAEGPRPSTPTAARGRATVARRSAR
ncbi:MAG: recombinase family protein [Polyangiales bacterium]